MDKYRRWMRELEASEEYLSAGLEIEFTEELARVMAANDISRAELARRSGTTPAYITKILRGSTNFTLATMDKLARALEMEINIHLAPRGSFTVWEDQFTTGQVQETITVPEYGDAVDRYSLRTTEFWSEEVFASVLHEPSVEAAPEGDVLEVEDDETAAAA